ncbi:MAG: hypothetical protein ABIG89_03880 [Candidatus Woesearchaeota archaeon]
MVIDKMTGRYVSPIGSTNPSPLRAYTNHGFGLSPNYGIPRITYENGGAIRMHSPIIHGQDHFSRTSEMYRTNAADVMRYSSNAKYNLMSDPISSEALRFPLRRTDYTSLLFQG